MIKIEESDMVFGDFDEERFWGIENSSIYKNLKDGIKTVEFILSTERNILFVEAKTSIPNINNRFESKEKSEKYEEFYSDLKEKFIHSINMLASTVMKRHENDCAAVPSSLYNVDNYQRIGICFVLVVATAEEEWLSGSRSEIELRLRDILKIWDAKVFVLNKKMAQDYKLVKV